MALFHRDKVKDSNLISFFLKEPARVSQYLTFRVKNDE